MNRILVGLTAALLGAACADPFPPQNLTVRISLTGDRCGVSTASATVQAYDMNYIGPVSLTVGAGEIYGTITGVPAGANRTVTVNAYNSNGYRVYTGSTTVTVVADATVDARIILQRDTYNCAATGSINITGWIANDGTPDGGVSDAGTLLATVDFQYDDVELTSDGVLHFLDPTGDRLHRYDLGAASARGSLAGSLDVVTMTVTPDGQFAYMAYTGGRMDAFNLDAGTSKFFAAAASTVGHLRVTGDTLFTVDGSGSWDTHSLFDRTTGTRLSSTDWGYGVRASVFSPAHQRVYTLDEGVSPTDLHMQSVDGGVLGVEVGSPYHGDYSIPNPLRLMPDETAVIVGSGIIFNTSDLTYRGSLGLAFTDLAFLGTKLYLIDPSGANTQLRVLGSDYSILQTTVFPGAPVRIFPWSGKLLLLTRASSKTSIRQLDP